MLFKLLTPPPYIPLLDIFTPPLPPSTLSESPSNLFISPLFSLVQNAQTYSVPLPHTPTRKYTHNYTHCAPFRLFNYAPRLTLRFMSIHIQVVQMDAKKHQPGTCSTPSSERVVPPTHNLPLFFSQLSYPGPRTKFILTEALIVELILNLEVCLVALDTITVRSSTR